MLSAFDKSLLNMLQTDLPIAKRPFAVLAERLGTEEAVVLERLTWLKENGYIRRIGPFFDSVA
ncbi:MAG: Lrp/AsnC family transcriptional regulator, partial [Selenomonadales bacterium]|nr:Lrp/AsnC family transcriptional regulator [Selenomonadales bacterium]